MVRWRAGWLGWFLDWLVGEFGWLAGFFTSSACSDSLLDSSAARACLLVGWLAGLLLYHVCLLISLCFDDWFWVIWES